ncbi:hypothetical protein [Caudoviricetes sp.]|nr:hypothetical protein [Caudoviricetes sp.]
MEKTGVGRGYPRDFLRDCIRRGTPELFFIDIPKTKLIFYQQ